MRAQRTRRRHRLSVPPALGVVIAVVALWLVGRYVADPGMDWLRERVSPEGRVAWAVIVLGAAAGLVAWALGHEQGRPANDREDD
jgi:hypothetical protein